MLMSSRYRALIEGAAAKYNLDPNVVQGVIEQESSGRWYALRYEPVFYDTYLHADPRYKGRDPREVASSYGLMQVMYSTAIENGFAGEPWDLFRPDVAIDLGCKYLASLVKWARSQYVGPSVGAENKIMRSALAAYNGGKKGNAPDDVRDRNFAYADSVFDKVNLVRRERAE